MTDAVAVVEVMSVQPTSAKCTALQLSGSAAKAAPVERKAARQNPATKDFVRDMLTSPICKFEAKRIFLPALYIAKHHFGAVSSAHTSTIGGAHLPLNDTARSFYRMSVESARRFRDK